MRQAGLRQDVHKTKTASDLSKTLFTGHIIWDFLYATGRT